VFNKEFYFENILIMDVMNIFSKEYWDFKDKLTKEYVNIFKGYCNIKSTKDHFEKNQNVIPGLIFTDVNLWSFDIDIIVKNEIKSFYSNTTKSFTRYKLKGTRKSDTSWNLKVKGRGNIDFSINNDQQIMYSSSEDFIMKYTVETF